MKNEKSLVEKYFESGGRYDQRIKELADIIVSKIRNKEKREITEIINKEINNFVTNTQLHILSFQKTIVEGDEKIIQRGQFRNVFNEVLAILNSPK